MTVALNRDPAVQFVTVPALPNASATAGGAGNNTAANGTTLDLTQIKGPLSGAIPVRAEAVVFSVVATSALTNGKAVTVTGKIQSSPDGATWTDLATLEPGSYTPLTSTPNSVTRTAGSSATFQDAFNVAADLEYVNGQYIRLVVTPSLNNTATDTCQVQAVAHFFGLSRQSAT